MLTGTQLLDGHSRVVVGHATQRVRDAAFDDYIALGPVNLQVAPGNGREKDAAFKASLSIDQRDAIVVFQVERGRVVSIYKDRVARGAGKWIKFVIDQCVELFAAARRDVELRIARGRWPIDFKGGRELHHAEMCFAVGRGKLPAGAQMRSAILD